MGMCYKAYGGRGVSLKIATSNLAIGFTRQLKQWWFNYLLQEEREKILDAITDKGENDSFITLIFSIIKHFIGNPADILNRQFDILMNLNYPKLQNFHCFKDMFLSRVLLKSKNQDTIPYSLCRS